jgi:hypothetical protein
MEPRKETTKRFGELLLNGKKIVLVQKLYVLYTIEEDGSLRDMGIFDDINLKQVMKDNPEYLPTLQLMKSFTDLDEIMRIE